MLSRRRFTATALSSGVLALPGCGALNLPQPQGADLGEAAIDAHMHLFNGRDVPALGFLKQVIFREMGDALPVGVLEPLAVMITTFLLAGTRTAGEELQSMGALARTATPPDDEAVLARAIDEYYGQARESGQAMVARSSAVQPATGEATARAAIPLPEPDAILLDELAKAAGVPLPEAAAGIPDSSAAMAPSVASGRSRAAAATPSLGQQLAPGLLTPEAGAADARGLNLAGVLQWATLMTRDRADIRARARALYGKPGEARIFCSYLVDMALWLDQVEPFGVSRMGDQIALASAQSRAEPNVLILNFVPFCPLRAALDGAGALAQVQSAIRDHGFAGVKLYPAMGFRPDDNGGISLAHANRRVRANPPPVQALDRALADLYRWCQAEDVPIATHASHSMGAGPGTAAYSAPWLWGPVLRNYPRLRVNLAHFGGFGGHSPREWQQQLGALMAEDELLFFDTGYWDGAARDQSDRPGGPLDTARRFLQTYDTAGRRMMYGSDWHMIAREPDHNRYHRQLHAFVSRLAGDQARTRAIMSGNALRWLGLDRPDGAQFRRLASHFGTHPVWQSLFGRV